MPQYEIPNSITLGETHIALTDGERETPQRRRLEQIALTQVLDHQALRAILDEEKLRALNGKTEGSRNDYKKKLFEWFLANSSSREKAAQIMREGFARVSDTLGIYFGGDQAVTDYVYTPEVRYGSDHAYDGIVFIGNGQFVTGNSLKTAMQGNGLEWMDPQYAGFDERSQLAEQHAQSLSQLASRAASTGVQGRSNPNTDLTLECDNRPIFLRPTFETNDDQETFHLFGIAIPTTVAARQSLAGSTRDIEVYSPTFLEIVELLISDALLDEFMASQYVYTPGFDRSVDKRLLLQEYSSGNVTERCAQAIELRLRNTDIQRQIVEILESGRAAGTWGTPGETDHRFRTPAAEYSPVDYIGEIAPAQRTKNYEPVLVAPPQEKSRYVGLPEALWGSKAGGCLRAAGIIPQTQEHLDLLEQTLTEAAIDHEHIRLLDCAADSLRRKPNPLDDTQRFGALIQYLQASGINFDQPLADLNKELRSSFSIHVPPFFLRYENAQYDEKADRQRRLDLRNALSSFQIAIETYLEYQVHGNYHDTLEREGISWEGKDPDVLLSEVEGKLSAHHAHIRTVVDGTPGMRPMTVERTHVTFGGETVPLYQPARENGPYSYPFRPMARRIVAADSELSSRLEAQKKVIWSGYMGDSDDCACMSDEEEVYTCELAASWLRQQGATSKKQETVATLLLAA